MSFKGIEDQTQPDMASFLYENFIDDPMSLSGKSVHRFIIDLNAIICCKYVTYLELSGTSQSLGSSATNVLLDRKFLKAIRSFAQFDWAFLLLTREATEWTKLDEAGPEIITQADTTIRLADNSTFCVYTKSEELHFYLNRTYECFVSRRITPDGITVYY